LGRATGWGFAVSIIAALALVIGGIQWVRRNRAPVGLRSARTATHADGRHRLEDALRKSEKRLAEAQRLAHLGSWELDLAKNHLWWSDEVYRIFEIDPDQFGASYEAFLETVHPEEREFVHHAYVESVQNKTPYDLAHRLLMKDGRVKYVHECCETDYDADGRPVRSIGTVLDVTERKLADEAIRQLAFHDSLTGLPNRAMLHDQLAKAIEFSERRRTTFAFLIMDLNDFKDINNTLGHHHGDLMIKEIGPRLQGVLRQSDTIARLGGDEFGLLLPDTDLDGALGVAKKIHRALEAPFKIEGLSILVEASIGVAVFPTHGATASAVIQHADVAMYAAKHTRTGTAVYAADRNHDSPRRLALMAELRYAIERDELTLYYQPKINLQTRRVIGVEALVRWNHPNRGLIPPDEFITLAERSGLIRPLTLRVLDMALLQARAWAQAGFQLRVAVNLSARNLQDAQLPEQILELLGRTGTSPDRLELEITESTIMADPNRSLAVLTRLHDMGIALAIDDFGTGYSSLSYLKRLPISAVKIDKSFVQNLPSNDNDAVIVRSTIELAHNLDLQVVAEGVETAYIWDRLVALGCDAAQGFYMSQPMPADALNQWFVESSWQVGLVPPGDATQAA
ncbi:MAG TPA: EAL domain-containing protein, partial [Nitrospiria bacterium]|nr:EAL domain-containing protein [Nitrospiria bacterium]